jgi:N-acetylmuramic acid 6-phosphate etherase
MIRLGRVYRGMMVHMRATNAKLRRRAEIMVAQIAGCTEAKAAEALAAGDGSVKLAAVMVSGMGRAEAEALLQRNGGNLRAAFLEMGVHGHLA